MADPEKHGAHKIRRRSAGPSKRLGVAGLLAAGFRLIAWVAGPDELPQPPPAAPKAGDGLARTLPARDTLPPPTLSAQDRPAGGWWRWILAPDHLPDPPAHPPTAAATTTHGVVAWLVAPEKVPDDIDAARSHGGPGAA